MHMPEIENDILPYIEINSVLQMPEIIINDGNIFKYL